MLNRVENNHSVNKKVACPLFSLRYKITFLFVLAIVLPALLLSFVLTSTGRRALRDSIFYQQQEILRRVADRINSQINRHQNLLVIHKNISTLPRKRQLDIAKDILAQGDAFSEIALLGSNGRERWKLDRSGKSRSLLNRSRRREYTEAKAGHNFISPVSFTGQRDPYIIFSVPLLRTKEVLISKLDLGQMWQWISQVRIGDTGHAFVVDHKGNLIAHKEPARVWAHSNFSSLEIVKDFMAYRQLTPGTWRQYKNERGSEVVSLYQPLPKMGWAVITQIPIKEVYQPIRQMYKSVIFWTIIWTGIFLFVGYKFVKRITDPIAKLQAGADQISKGKLDIKLNIKTRDEIQELAGNFEKMAAALKQLEELRQDLTRMIIHDLKSPLSGIMGGLDYLESGMMGQISQDQKNIVSLAKKSSENMLVMIQNLLDVAKLEEGKLNLRKERFDLTLILNERKQQFEPLAKNEGKVLTVEIEPDIPAVEIDGQLIQRVINNLITNAMHHTISGGKITLGLKKADGSVEVWISDNGIGIPPEYREKIFEKFVQVERRQAKLRTGAGLGLTFCKMAVEAHGGAIRVESELQKGSSFIFALPVS